MDVFFLKRPYEIQGDERLEAINVVFYNANTDSISQVIATCIRAIVGNHKDVLLVFTFLSIYVVITMYVLLLYIIWKEFIIIKLRLKSVNAF